VNQTLKNILISGGFLLAGVGIVYYFNKSKEKNINSILFIGDSNTVANYSYADKLRQSFPNLKVKKIAKVGEKTDWALRELQKELSENKYDVVAVLIGSNDIYALNSNTEAKQNLDKIYNLIKSKGSKVLAVTPPNKDFYVQRTQKKQELLYDLVDWMRKNKNIDYLVDFHKITADKKYFSSTDGFLHANSLAHNILAEQTKTKLNLNV
jgi:hypothetical protein